MSEHEYEGYDLARMRARLEALKARADRPEPPDPYGMQSAEVAPVKPPVAPGAMEPIPAPEPVEQYEQEQDQTPWLLPDGSVDTTNWLEVRTEKYAPYRDATSPAAWNETAVTWQIRDGWDVSYRRRLPGEEGIEYLVIERDPPAAREPEQYSGESLEDIARRLISGQGTGAQYRDWVQYRPEPQHDTWTYRRSRFAGPGSAG